jgi:hypothetical protein
MDTVDRIIFDTGNLLLAFQLQVASCKLNAQHNLLNAQTIPLNRLNTITIAEIYVTEALGLDRKIFHTTPLSVLT